MLEVIYNLVSIVKTIVQGLAGTASSILITCIFKKAYEKLLPNLADLIKSFTLP